MCVCVCVDVCVCGCGCGCGCGWVYVSVCGDVGVSVYVCVLGGCGYMWMCGWGGG